MTPLRSTLQLLLLVLLCYGTYYRWAPGDETVIEMTPSLTERILEQREQLYGRSLTADEREEAVASYIEEELLVREAFRRGLDRNDRRVRPMLIDHSRRELLRSVGYEPPEPSEAELQAYFEEHAERYRIPERIAVHQVLFPTGTAPVELEEVLVRLRAGADFENIGAAGPGADVKEVTRSQVARAYGLELAREIFALPEGEWHGPFVSEVGTHFFRTQNRRPPVDRRYEDVKDYLEQDYLSEDAERLVEAELVRIRRRYLVEVEDER